MQDADHVPEPSVPEILLKLEDTEVDEGGLVKFMAKITGYPKPRVTWFVNKDAAISVIKILFKNKKQSNLFLFKGRKI